MAHLRKRHLTPLIQKGLAFKGIVGIFGHRQVGKTTLLEILSTKYCTLDIARELQRVIDNPDYFLKEISGDGSVRPVAIDECQFAPPLFPALKEFVRNHKQPGLFLLSGSVRFSSRKAIRESLTGRMLGYELLPFSVSELDGEKMNTTARDLLTADFKNFKFLRYNKSAVALAKNSSALRYLERGGLPGICFVRNARDRGDLQESQLQMILDRDIRLVSDIKLPLSGIRRVVEVLAENQNEPLHLTDIKRRTRVSEPTLRKVLSGMEAVFLLRTLPCEGDETHPVYFMEDQGDAHYLASGRFDATQNLERLAFAHLRVPFAYEPGIHTEFFQYRKHGGAYVQFVFRRGRKVIGFICTLDPTPSLGALRSGASLRRAYPGAKTVYIHPHSEIAIFSSDEASVPITYFL